MRCLESGEFGVEIARHGALELCSGQLNSANWVCLHTHHHFH